MPGKRGDVAGLSVASRRRLLHLAHNGPEWCAMLRLSYSDWPTDGREVKRHLNTFLVALRRKCRGVSYAWVLEFQKRGAPHFHVLVNSWVGKEWLTTTWARVIGQPDNRTATNVTRVNDGAHAARYLAKYAAKEEQKEVPAGFRYAGRMWGASRDVGKASMEVLLNVEQGDKLRRTLQTAVEKRTGKQGRRRRQGVTLYKGAGLAIPLLTCFAEGEE